MVAHLLTFFPLITGEPNNFDGVILAIMQAIEKDSEDIEK